MEFKGTFEDGVVRPDEPVNLPSGTRVEFQPLDNGDAGGVRPLTEAELRSRHQHFWQSPGIEELLANREEPVASAADLLGTWPAQDEDIEEFLRFIRENRR